MAAQNVLVKDLQGVETLGMFNHRSPSMLKLILAHHIPVGSVSTPVSPVLVMSHGHVAYFARHGQDWYANPKPNDGKDLMPRFLHLPR